jgi:DeoR/GlpR family transcriptional regulator of sugar metabolism
MKSIKIVSERKGFNVLSQRGEEIIKLLSEKSPISIEELASRLSVSEVTIRRDLSSLEKAGLVIRQWGKAFLPGLGIEPVYNQRQKVNPELKRRIAKYTAGQISDGEVIALDVGTTNAELAGELIKRTNITVFTSSFQVASILSRSQLNVYMVGGFLRKSEMSMVGSIATETIMKFNFDRFYLGLAGISKEEGPTDFNLEDVDVKKAFIRRSKKVIALVDKTKFGQTGLVKVCEMNDIDEIITNQEAAKENRFEEWDYKGKITLV